jgi:hypothetical protein
LERRRKAPVSILAIVFLLVLLVGLIWANLFYIGLAPTRGNFLPRWLGTRLFLTESLSPYSPETTAQIQKAQKAGSGAPAPGESYFLYPFYSFVAYFPFALTANQTAARAAWMTMLEIAMLATLGVSLSLSRWRVPPWAFILVLLFSLTWYYAVRPILDGDLAVLVGLFVVVALAAIRAEQDALAGFLLALAMCKPPPVLLLLIFILVWAASNDRWLLIWSFLGCLALMIAATSLLIPDWLAQNIRQVIQYLRLPLAQTPGRLIAVYLPGIGKQLGILFTVICAVVLVFEWGQALRKDFRWFYWTACLTLAITPLTGLPNNLNNFILMFPGLILILATWDERWGKVGKGLILASLAILSAGVWLLVIGAERAGVPPDQNPWLFFVLPMFMLVGAYWVRWWAIRPPRLPVNEMAERL